MSGTTRRPAGPGSGTRRALLGGLALAAATATVAPARALAQAAATEGGAQKRPWPAGRPTPEVALPAWEGPAWTLSAQRGQVVVVNFWASWCEPCRAEMPSLELLAARHERDRLQVVAVNFRETDAALRRFLASMPITLPILRDADGAVAKAWGVRVFPSTAVIGRDGRVAFVVTGEVDWTGAEARRWIDPLIRA
ncbi:MAG: hypothetical protein RJA99_3868 [Pseudomonadota bacterium]|jgi:thiol-disulfide isomerase/thioredoxin